MYPSMIGSIYIGFGCNPQEKRFMIDKQIALHFYATKIINLFLNSIFLANPEKGEEF